MTDEFRWSGPFIKVPHDIVRELGYNPRKLTRWLRAQVAERQTYQARRRQRLAHRDWLEILARFNYRCAYCGAEGKLQQDHRLPVALGGAAVISNIVPACRSCNLRKRAEHPDLWPVR